jgi:hypothetical protein
MGHNVEFIMDGNKLAEATTPYYNRTWETFKFQTCMIKALNQYKDSVESSIYSNTREKTGTRGLKKTDKEQALAQNDIYQALDKLYKAISDGDKGKITENKKA